MNQLVPTGLATVVRDVSPLVTATSASFTAGVFIHLAIFRFGEWDQESTRLVAIFVGLLAALTGILTAYSEAGYTAVWPAFKVSLSVIGSLLAGTFSSMLVYRAFFHRLKRFPGPILARLSNGYVAFLSVKKFQLYEEVQALHKKYGDVVRIGPTELSIIDPTVFHLVNAQSSPCTKGPFYTALHPLISLHQTRDRKDHAKRRKTWDRAFSVKALRDYEPRVANYTDKLIDKISEQDGKPLDVTHWFNFYSFDVMGDLAFGKSFNMLRDGIVHDFMAMVHANMLILGAFKHLIWIFSIFKEVPIINSENLKFNKWLGKQVHERRKNKPDIPDVFSWILSDFDAIAQPTKQEKLNLVGDANLIVVAGSDTTAASLTALFFQLAMEITVCKDLQAELDEYFLEHERPDHVSLSKLQYFQACIDESLRLFPPVPSGVQRMMPPEGLQAGDIYIPGNTLVSVPSYTIYRDDRMFVHPNKYIPERWTSEKHLTKNASIFAPFSTGRYSCVGRQLGLMEIRYVASQILHRYDVKLAPSVDAKAFVEGMKDGFTLAPPKLELVFTPRQPIARAPAADLQPTTSV
ncbi:benzoate 4-monooxygenase cytochrome P450 [Thozetella sp. PMI_491]|nr:benzoate 4-monooxygenase cytochrome P450 [Thozetella sp. PMI_491]